MGQLDIYAIMDIFILALFGGFLSGYFSVEVNGSIEQVSPYTYSGQLYKKKLKKMLNVTGVVTDKRDASHYTWLAVDITNDYEYDIFKGINEKITWFDPTVAGWEGAKEKEKLEKLETRHNW